MADTAQPQLQCFAPFSPGRSTDNDIHGLPGQGAVEQRFSQHGALVKRSRCPAFSAPGEKGFVRPRPVFIYVGRVSVEKNLEAFLQLDLPGSKIIVGDGPARQMFEDKYPDVEFTGYRKGGELAYLVAMADVFVFPSLTDTFGVVMLEAMASGVPVAAYPVTGPKELVVEGVNGCLNEDLKEAALNALNISPDSCRQFALNYSWDCCSRQFMDNLVINEHQF